MGAVVAAICPKPLLGEVLIRAWVEDADRNTVTDALAVASCSCAIYDEEGVELAAAAGDADGAGTEYVKFDLSVVLAAEHAYRLHIRVVPSVGDPSEGHVPVPTVR